LTSNLLLDKKLGEPRFPHNPLLIRWRGELRSPITPFLWVGGIEKNEKNY